MPSKNRLSQESQTISKLSRDELEDKHLRLLQESLHLKKIIILNEENSKQLLVRLNKSKILIDSPLIGGNSTSKCPYWQNKVFELETKLSSLSLINERLVHKLHLSTIHLKSGIVPKSNLVNFQKYFSGHRKYSCPFIKSENNIDSKISKAPIIQERYGRRLLDQARKDNQRLEDLTLYLKTQLYNIEFSLLEKDNLHKIRCEKLHQLNKTLNIELTELHSKYEIEFNKDKIEILRLKMELLDKSNNLEFFKSENISLMENRNVLRERYSKLIEQLKIVEVNYKKISQRNSDLLGQVQSLSLIDKASSEQIDIFTNLKAENKLLKTNIDNLIKELLKNEEVKTNKFEDESLKNKIEKMEVEYKSNLEKKSNIIDRMQNEKSEKIRYQSELFKINELHSKLQTDYKIIQSKLSFVTENSSFEWSEIEKSILYLKYINKCALNSSENSFSFELFEKIKKELAESRSSHAETILELEKVRKLLEVQHQISSVESEKSDNIRKHIYQLCRDYDCRINKTTELLKDKSRKIYILERKLRKIFYGTKKTIIRQQFNEIDSDERKSINEEIDFQSGQNLVEIQIQQLIIQPELIRIFSCEEPLIFLSYDFFEFDTAFTPILKGICPKYRSKSQFIVNIDDFFFHYLLNETVLIYVYQALGFEFTIIAQGELDIKSILNESIGSSKTNLTTILSGVNKFKNIIQFGTLEYWINLRNPLKDSYSLYKDKKLAYLSLTDNIGTKMPISFKLNEIVITIVQCLNLIPRRTGFIPSSYVIYKFINFPDVDTNTISKSYSPKFDHTVLYPVIMDRYLQNYLTNELFFYVFDDSDTDFKNFLGFARVILQPLLNAKIIHTSLTLFDLNNKPVGNLICTLNWSKNPFTITQIPNTNELKPDAQNGFNNNKTIDDIDYTLYDIHNNFTFSNTTNINTDPAKFRHTIVGDKTKKKDNATLQSHVTTRQKIRNENHMNNDSESIKNTKYCIFNVNSDNNNNSCNTSIDPLLFDVQVLKGKEKFANEYNQKSCLPRLTSQFLDNNILNKFAILSFSELISSIKYDAFTISIHSITFTDNSAFYNANSDTLFIDYEFLNYDIEELEVPEYIFKPSPGDTVYFNFNKSFHFNSSSDKVLKKQMLKNMLQGIKDDSTVTIRGIKFSLVSEPEIEKENAECKEIGFGLLNLSECTNTMFDDVQTSVPIFGFKDNLFSESIIAYLIVYLHNLENLRQFVYSF